jgi:outer membrane protein with beta-barrel domain
MFTSCRPLALTAAFIVTSGAGAAVAQTVIARGVPADSTVEFFLNTATVGTATPNADGDATIAAGQSFAAGKAEMDAHIYVDTCATVRRVLVVDRNIPPPEPAAGCSRAQVAGLFLVRNISTLVVSVSGPNPTVLLRQGPFTIRTGPPRTWAASPTGLIVFGGGGFANFGNFSAFACGDVIQCNSDNGGLAWTAGVTLWFKPFLGVEASYLRPAQATPDGSGSNYRFNSFLDAHVVNIAGKIGIPAGPVRFYGQSGVNYHRAKSGTTQTIDDSTVTVDGQTRTIPGGTQNYGIETSGWGWSFGGGTEVWLKRSFALYGEFERSALKGDARDGSEGSMNDHVTAFLFGARIKIGK